MQTSHKCIDAELASTDAKCSGPAPSKDAPGLLVPSGTDRRPEAVRPAATLRTVSRVAGNASEMRRLPWIQRDRSRAPNADTGHK